MSQIRIALCANGVPLDNIQIEGIDTSQYSSWVDVDDQVGFAGKVTYFMGCAHGIMGTPAGEGNTFSVEVRSGLNGEAIRAVRKHMAFTEDYYLKSVLNGQGYTVDQEALVFHATPLVRH